MTNDEKRRILCGLIADGKNARIHTERAVLILESIGKFTFQAVDLNNVRDPTPKVFFYESIQHVFVGEEKVF